MPLARLWQEHRAGEKLFVDEAGQTVPVQDRQTGALRPAQIFVAVWGASNSTYAEATWTQTLPDWIGSHVRAVAFFGGVPQLVVPDNLRSGVTKACRYEPELNPTSANLAQHDGVAVIPARVRTPCDKATVEAGILLVSGGSWPVYGKAPLLQSGGAQHGDRRLLGPAESPPLQETPRLSAVPVRGGGPARPPAVPHRALCLGGVAPRAGDYRFACRDRGPLLQRPFRLGAPGLGHPAHGDHRRVLPQEPARGIWRGPSHD